MLFRQLIAAMDRQTDVLDQRLRAIERLLARAIGLPRPGALRIEVREENEMLVFDVMLPFMPEEPNDIVGGKLTYSIGGADPVIMATEVGQLLVEGLRGNDGDTVALSFVWVDDAGNESVEPSELEAVLTDTFPPPNPGELGIMVTGEEFV